MKKTKSNIDNIKLNEYIKRIDNAKEDGMRVEKAEQENGKTSISLLLFYEDQPTIYVEGEDFDSIIEDANRGMISIIEHGLFFTSDNLRSSEVVKLYSKDIQNMLRSHYMFMEENQKEDSTKKEIEIFKNRLEEYEKNLAAMWDLLKRSKDEEKAFQALRDQNEPRRTERGKIDAKEYSKPRLLIAQEIDARRNVLPYYETPSETIENIKKDLHYITKGGDR